MNLGQEYNRDDFLLFLASFLPIFTKDVRRVNTDGLQVTKEAFYLGKSAELDIEIFELTHSSFTDARVALAKDGFKVMKNSATYRALVIYQAAKGDDWRLSLMTATPSVSQKGKIFQSLSNPRRFSFFLGPNAKINTPYQLLIKQGAVKHFAELQKRFSLEVVNKEFYTQVAILFTKLAGGKRQIGSKSFDAGIGLIRLPGVVDDTLRKEFAVKLIGRLVFCWFLKKKQSDKGLPLLSEELLSPQTVKENNEYYHNILEPLFFEVLNTPIKERQTKYKRPSWAKVPFLNGGLFSDHPDDFYETDSLGVSKHINTLKIPDEWIKELFDVFETYNFTIDENTSFDVELSIDPEMLGRIFENLLAEIIPETGETARKATGSYYTTRVIVDYMIEQCLMRYLLSKTGVPKDKLKSLLSYEDDSIDLTDSEKSTLVKALKEIKVIDPACGSGAFIMGTLHRMLLVLEKVDPKLEIWRGLYLSTYHPVMRRIIEDKLRKGNEQYIRKLTVIQDSIYGVDIQPIAVEIAKLRCFLSLIVDELVFENEENRGVEPLPNLEFKFVAANTLIGLPSAASQSAFGVTVTIKKLKELREAYLRSFGGEKSQIEKEFRATQQKLFKENVKWALTDAQAKQLTEWDPFSYKPCSWFAPQWMFGVEDGFDIVIANPQYGVSIKGDERTAILRTLSKVPDYEIFYFFIQLAHNLLKPYGQKAYIIPNTILFNVFARKYRLNLLKNWDIQLIIDCTSFKLFQAATIHNVITFFQKNNGSKNIGYKNTNDAYNILDLISRPTLFVEREELIKNNMNWGLVFKLDQETLFLTQKIRAGKELLKCYFPDISQGLIAYDKYRGQTEEIIRNRVYHYHEKIKSTLKPWLWGEDVKRYLVTWNQKEYIDYCDGIANPREPKFFKGQRILVREITNPSIFAAITTEELYHDPSIIVVMKAKDFSIFCLLAILNSKLASFYHFNSAPKATKGSFPKILVKDIQEFPLPSINIEQTTILDNLVNKIGSVINDKDYLSNPEKQTKVTEYEYQIDQMVYELYGLTPEEIGVLEGKVNTKEIVQTEGETNKKEEA